LQARAAAASRQSELAQLLADVSSSLAAATAAAEDKRSQLAAVREGMAAMFGQLLGALGVSGSGIAQDQLERQQFFSQEQQQQAAGELATTLQPGQQQDEGGAAAGSRPADLAAARDQVAAAEVRHVHCAWLGQLALTTILGMLTGLL
jgi:hypothetical protein